MCIPSIFKPISLIIHRPLALNMRRSSSREEAAEEGEAAAAEVEEEVVEEPVLRSHEPRRPVRKRMKKTPSKETPR